MTADENNRVELYQSVLHQSAEDYLEKLRLYGAEETARRFQNQLSDIPASSKAFDWNNENKTLKILEESLKVAESTQQWSEAEGLAQEILILDPKNRLAEATLKRLKDNKDELILEKGSILLEEKQYAEAIALFKKISQESPLHPEARNLIASADREVQIALSLKNAEEQLRVGNWEGASIILKQILEYDAENPGARQLLDEAESNHFWSRMENVFYLLMALIAASATIWWLYQKREQLGSIFSNNNDEPLNLKTFPNVNLKGDANIPPNPDEKRFAETLAKTSEFLSLAKKRDFSGEHATRLMDFETEIKIISSKALEPDADFKRLNTQLMVLMQTLRGLKFKGRPQQRKTKTENRKNEQQKENFYQLLGVKPSASESEIKKAYHQKIKEYHPDKHQNTEFEWVREQAANMSRELTNAYKTLSDRASRERYDATLS
jgi:tetratricopeptide (TPR) repeat protein